MELAVYYNPRKVIDLYRWQGSERPCHPSDSFYSLASFRRTPSRWGGFWDFDSAAETQSQLHQGLQLQTRCFVQGAELQPRHPCGAGSSSQGLGQSRALVLEPLSSSASTPPLHVLLHCCLVSCVK